jgi:hypothetical protein
MDLFGNAATVAHLRHGNLELAFTEIKVPPRVGWDGVVAQILDSATDGEQPIMNTSLVTITCLKLLTLKTFIHSAEGVHHILEVSIEYAEKSLSIISPNL